MEIGHTPNSEIAYFRPFFWNSDNGLWKNRPNNPHPRNPNLNSNPNLWNAKTATCFDDGPFFCNKDHFYSNKERFLNDEDHFQSDKECFLNDKDNFYSDDERFLNDKDQFYSEKRHFWNDEDPKCLNEGRK